jgi:serine/threonine protein kinase
MNDPEKTGAYQPETADATGVRAIPAKQPQQIGRYRVEKILGEGGFGVVFLAHDDQLQRLVAIKVPHRHRVTTTEDAETYLTEARTVVLPQSNLEKRFVRVSITCTEVSS